MQKNIAQRRFKKTAPLTPKKSRPELTGHTKEWPEVVLRATLVEIYRFNVFSASSTLEGAGEFSAI
jgi:hypothetical protein